MMRINGTELAETILQDLKKRVGELQKNGVIPHLAILLIGNDPASVSYINQKSLRAEDIGAKVTLLEYPVDVTTEELLEKIKTLNNDFSIHGIIVQRPTPESIDTVEINYAVKPEKDVDAFHPETFFTPPIALAVEQILTFVKSQRETNIPYISWLKDKEIVILGKGEAGGRPIMQYFDSLKIPYQSIDTKTQHPENIIKQADIVISAVGKPQMIKKEDLKKDVILISVGLKKIDGKLVGDYDEAEIESIASFYTPSPGGVGPVNVATLLSNLVLAAEQSVSI